tara:strand:+ start:1048 stop:2220 length:1173 start_codon:yes stop_codon:yes gene_type:complete
MGVFGMDDPEKETNKPWSLKLPLWMVLALLVYVLLLGVSLVGAGFKWVSGGAEGAAAIFGFANHPLAGVILGVLATALVQSSSTVTSVIVGLVAGGVPVSIAIPMIMGANMGTTITNTIVSLGAIGNDLSFKRSFQAATVHDFFNLYCIFIFLPIEILFHPLERIAGIVSIYLSGSTDSSISGFNLIGGAIKPPSEAILEMLAIFSDGIGGSITILLGIALIIYSVIYLGKVLRSAMTGKAKELVENAVGKRQEIGVLSGGLVTILVQSSSTTTSLVVPLAGAGVLTLRQIFPFTMGANIGTTVTALLAATSLGGELQVLALQIALVHLFYNLFGVLMFLYIPVLTRMPIKSATWLGELAGSNRLWAFGYLFALFFLLPGSVFLGQMLFK